MRLYKLALVGFFTAAICVLYFWAFENQRLVATYRCLTGARHWYSCYFDRDFDFTTDFYGMRYEGNTKNRLDRDVLYSGGFEKPVLHFLRDTAKGFEKPGNFLDVGANTGQHSMFMSRYAQMVYAFEPYEPVLKKFRRLIEINNIRNIAIFPVGLGDRYDKRPFFAPPESNLGLGSFVKGSGAQRADPEQLEIVVGDDALAQANVESIALIKMDIEGFEKPALKGLSRTLNRNRPVVVVEVSTDPSNPVGVRSREELQSLFPSNYRFLVFDKSPELYRRGAYHLTELTTAVRFHSAEGQGDNIYIVAYPLENDGRIPRLGGQ